uniref:G-protein coupled receptors family 1 profile domain-containing protein n=2 Tax=Pan TaxID=9596 RepID=A0A2I3RFU2_PANTR
MKRANHTELREFVFQGFSNFPEHHVLSTSETFYSLVIIPRMLSSLVSPSQSISLEGCGTQIFFFLGFAITNCLLLAVMEYDHYVVAVCNPLRYPVIMNWRVCAILASSVCATGFSLSLVQSVAIFRLLFCTPLIEHFFCDIQPVLDLAWATPMINDILTLIMSLLAITAPATFLFISYVLIISTILKITSAEGGKKTFATYASHLTVVIIHYGCASIAYFKPNLKNTKDQDQLISVTYTVITPLLNPVVYGLRNKEVQDALQRVLGRKFFS